VLKISRLTDYGVVLTGVMAKSEALGNSTHSARDLAMRSGLPEPTVAKILKIMTKSRLISATRGAGGGYRLAENWGQITLLEVIEAFEGRQSLTSCIESRGLACQIEARCRQKSAWHDVNHKIRSVLGNVSMNEMLNDLVRAS
jgi:FeS assembly SUF system regulator